MKRIKLSLLLLIASFAIQAQTEITLFGYIYNANTDEPLAYVNIGFINEQVGTVSNEYGRFDLVYKESRISPNSILQISSIGFKTIKIKAIDFYKQMGQDNSIFLTPQTYNLDEVLISNELRKERSIGTLNLNEKTIGYWLNSEALGGELASKIPIEKEKTKLHELLFYVNKNNSGSFKVRVNVYEYKQGLPGKNLLNENIYHTISTRSGVEAINLEPYNIVVNDDIVVSLELVKVYGNYIDFEIAGSLKKNHSFTRQISQDKWKRHHEQGMAFKLKTSYPSPKGKILAKKRDLPQRITLYWDSSLSQKDGARDLTSELDLLKKYLKQLDYASLEVVKFSTTINESKAFSVTSKTIDDIIEYLLDTTYEGESSFSNILKSNVFEADVALLFSDGKTLLEPLEQEIYLPTFAINSSVNANHSGLQSASFYGDGHYLDLSKSSVRDCLSMMIEEHNDNEDYALEDELNDDFVFGQIKSDSLFLPGAKIILKNTYNQTVSNSNGNFKIKAERGDVLTVTALGMQSKDVVVPEDDLFVIDLEPDAEILKEVVLYGKAEKPNMVMTPYGARNEDAVGFSIDELDMSLVNHGNHHIDQIVAKLPGVVIYGVGQNKRYMFVRNLSKKSEVPIIVIDGIIYTQHEGLDKLPPIDIQTLKSVKAVKSVVGTNRYGGLGAYGAIVIQTEATYVDLSSNNDKRVSALATNNDYSDSLVGTLDQIQKQPNYVLQLEKTTSFEQAKRIYQNVKQSEEKNKIDFYIKASDYFLKWDKDFALSVLSNIATLAPNNAKALRALAYKFEEFQEYHKARHIYEHIKQIQPNEAQVYRDLAQIYEATGNYQEALELYKLMLTNQILDIDFTAVQNVLANDLIHLISSHRSKLNVKHIPSDYLKADFKLDSRIVFEWNDPNAEFEVQFVNPNNKFYKWSNTVLENKEAMFDKVINGHSVEEHIIDDAQPPGTWLINIESINNTATNNPTYLKYTVYKNFGLPNETREIKVLELNTHQQKVNIYRLFMQ